MRSLLLLAALAVSPAVLAQDGPTLCESDKADGLDFWLGTWNLEWTSASGTASGTNAITRELGECVVHERFSSETGFEGESVSVYTPSGWRQTWVDNSGGYLLFTGTTGEDDRVLEMRMDGVETPEGTLQVNRMMWEDVTESSLTWRWQSSTDGGATWRDLWVIYYTRAE